MTHLVRAGRAPGEGCGGLPRTAFLTHFGMTPIERSFLVEQTYGRKYVGDESRFETGTPSEVDPSSAERSKLKKAAA